MTTPTDEAVAREVHARLSALRLVQHATDSGAAPAAGDTGPAAIWRHVLRAPGDPVDLAVRRALASDAKARAMYGAMLRSRVRFHSPDALAASTGAPAERAVGPHRLRIVPAAGSSPPALAIALDQDAGPAPGVIEALGAPESGGDGVRLALPPAIRHHVVLPLDPADAGHATLLALLADPATEVWLS